MRSNSIFGTTETFRVIPILTFNEFRTYCLGVADPFTWVKALWQDSWEFIVCVTEKAKGGAHPTFSGRR